MALRIFTEHELLVRSWRSELATTVKVLKEFPAGQDEFRPAQKSRTARELAWAFVMGQYVAYGACTGQLDFSQPDPLPPPGSVCDMIPVLEKALQNAVSNIEALDERDFEGPIQFPVGPGTMGTPRLADVLWGVLHDTIHHRGQFSVYLRIVGAKVPSIYGPTADESWM